MVTDWTSLHHLRRYFHVHRRQMVAPPQLDLPQRDAAIYETLDRDRQRCRQDQLLRCLEWRARRDQRAAAMESSFIQPGMECQDSRGGAGFSQGLFRPAVAEAGHHGNGLWIALEHGW